MAVQAVVITQYKKRRNEADLRAAPPSFRRRATKETMMNGLTVTWLVSALARLLPRPWPERRHSPTAARRTPGLGHSG